MPAKRSKMVSTARSRFFEKKRRKKLRGLWCGGTFVETPQAQSNKSLFGSFSSEKEPLPARISI
jgi:hypothetical protein